MVRAQVRFAFDLSSDDEGEIDAKRVPPARKDKVLGLLFCLRY